jgi:hypothetical protein
LYALLSSVHECELGAEKCETAAPIRRSNPIKGPTDKRLVIDMDDEIIRNWLPHQGVPFDASFTLRAPT